MILIIDPISCIYPNMITTLKSWSPDQATALNCGFNCTHKCHLCDADDWHVVTRDAEWRGSVGGRRRLSPFKTKRNPMMSIPGMETQLILPDSCHCCHLGWGVDFAASGLVLLAKRGFFGIGTLNTQLHVAYKQFMEWCSATRKTTGIDWWSVKKLDMASTLITI